MSEHRTPDKQTGLRREKWRGLLVVEDSREHGCVQEDVREFSSVH
jgi:hypothetical protein